MKKIDNEERPINRKPVFLTTFFKFKEEVEDSIKTLGIVLCVLIVVDLIIVGTIVYFSVFK